MALTFIDEDGGKLPEAVTAPTASQLLADYNALDSGEKAAFRLAIRPKANNVAAFDDVADITNAQPGDFSTITAAPGVLARLTAPALSASATREADWMNLFGGEFLGGGGAGLNPIPGDGGHLPGNGASSRLVEAWNMLGPDQKRAFRLAIKPAFSNVANEAARLALASQVPGDYCRQVDEGLYKHQALPASTDGNWTLIHAN